MSIQPNNNKEQTHNEDPSMLLSLESPLEQNHIHYMQRNIMYSTMLKKLVITTRITSWERDNHIATCISLSPSGDYSRMAMVSRSLMDRCSPEGRWRSTAVRRGTAAADWRGGSSPWRGGGGSLERRWRLPLEKRRRQHLEAAAALGPPLKLGYGASMEEVLLS